MGIAGNGGKQAGDCRETVPAVVGATPSEAIAVGQFNRRRSCALDALF